MNHANFMNHAKPFLIMLLLVGCIVAYVLSVQPQGRFIFTERNGPSENPYIGVLYDKNENKSYAIFEFLNDKAENLGLGARLDKRNTQCAPGEFALIDRL